MIKHLRYSLLALAVMAGGMLHAQNSPEAVDNAAVKGAWFCSGIYSFNIANNGHTYSRLGVTGGYFRNWGGYAKIDFSLIGTRTPNISAGFIKRLATFRSGEGTVPSTLNFYFGLGYANLAHCREYPEHDHIYHPDGSTECVPGTDRIVKFWDSSAGLLAETGVIYRYRHLNFTLGYSIALDVAGGIVGTGNSANHSITVGVGYSF